MLEAIGMAFSLLEAASAGSTLFTAATITTDAATAGYDYLHTRTVQKAAQKVWRENTEIRKYARSVDELSRLIKDGDNYAHQTFTYSEERCAELRIDHKEYKVTWNDGELGEFVRLGRMISAGQHKPNAFSQVGELVRIGQARYILMAELMFNLKE